MGIKIGKNALHDIARPVVVKPGQKLNTNGVFVAQTEKGERIYLLRDGKFIKIVRGKVQELNESDVAPSQIRDALNLAINAAIENRERSIRRLRRLQRELDNSPAERISITIAHVE